jgi:CDP-glucose 4,6-dehydratase
MENMVDFCELENVYRGKKVFITGHTGFKGAWMLKTLSLLGAKIKGYALKNQTTNDIYQLIDGQNLCNSVIKDVRDKDSLELEILAFQPDFIFHLAAQPLVRMSYEIPTETFEVNVIGTAHVLDAVKLLNKKCSVILITTDKVYYNEEWVYPYRENDRLGGYDPYSASKACAELLIDSYRNSFFNPKEYDKHLKGVAVARAGNVIGGGDWSKDRLVPDIVRSLIANKPVIIRNPNAMRPWQHVLEPVLGYLILGLHLDKKPLDFAKAFNFGPQLEDVLSVEDMVKLAIKSWGSGEYKILEQDGQLHEAGILKLDISKAISELNWYPKLNSSQTLFYTMSWYKEFFYNKKDILSFSINQIKSFLS